MRPLVRLFVLWLLIVSLPMQGVAATVNLPCTMAHGSAASHGVEAMDHCDDPGIMPQASVHAANAGVHQDMPCDQGSHQKHSTCRACSACSAGASAPPPFAIPVPPAGHFANDCISFAPSMTGWIPSPIERPPRR